MKKYIYRTIIFIIGVSLFSSCLKDESLVLNPDEGVNVIEFDDPADPIGVGQVYTLYPLSVDVAEEVQFTIPVSFSGPIASAPEDIQVTVEVGSNSVIDEYNDEQSTAYELMDPSLYNFSNNVVINRGNSKGSLVISFKSNQFDFSKKYALPLKITKSSNGNISGNFGTIILGIGPKNKFDGNYFGEVILRGSAVSDHSDDTNLFTTGVNSIAQNNLGLYFGGFTNFTIDEASGTVAVGSFAGRGGRNYGANVLESSYDSDTGNFHVKYTILGGAYTFDETYTKQ